MLSMQVILPWKRELKSVYVCETLSTGSRKRSKTSPLLVLPPSLPPTEENGQTSKPASPPTARGMGRAGRMGRVGKRRPLGGVVESVSRGGPSRG